MGYRVSSRSVAALLAIIYFCVLLSGCWDRRELQDRSFVLAAAIDVADAGEQGSQGGAVTRTETFVQPHGAKRYRLSLQVLRLVAESEKDETAGEGKTFILSNTGQSISEMIRDTLGQSSKNLYFEHLQTIIVSEVALKEAGGLNPLIDLFRRDRETRWRIKVLVTSGEARPLLEYIPPSGEAGGIYLAKMAEQPKNVHIAPLRSDLGFISQYLDAGFDLALPRVEMADGVVKLGGQAMFKKDRFVGYLDEYAVKGLRLIRGTEKSAIITARCPEHQAPIVFELFDHDTRLTPHVDGENVFFTLDIVMRGNIGEILCPCQSILESEYIPKMEELFAEEVRQNIMYTMDECRRLRADAVWFGRKLKAHYPAVWQKTKERWDEIFPTVPLNVSVKVIIRGIGDHK